MRKPRADEEMVLKENLDVFCDLLDQVDADIANQVRTAWHDVDPFKLLGAAEVVRSRFRRSQPVVVAVANVLHRLITEPHESFAQDKHEDFRRDLLELTIRHDIVLFQASYLKSETPIEIGSPIRRDDLVYGSCCLDVAEIPKHVHFELSRQIGDIFKLFAEMLFYSWKGHN